MANRYDGVSLCARRLSDCYLFAGHFLTIHDKQRAKQHERRIPERTLMLIGLAGGALAMYLTMRAIRHKTLHRKFMWGLPAEIALQAILACAAVFCIQNYVL